MGGQKSNELSHLSELYRGGTKMALVGIEQNSFQRTAKYMVLKIWILNVTSYCIYIYIPRCIIYGEGQLPHSNLHLH